MNERVEIYRVQPDEPLRGEAYAVPTTTDLVEQLREEHGPARQDRGPRTRERGAAPVINGHDMTIAHHEAGHAISALHFGRRVDFVGRERHGGLTTYDHELVACCHPRTSTDLGSLTPVTFPERTWSPGWQRAVRWSNGTSAALRVPPVARVAVRPHRGTQLAGRALRPTANDVVGQR